MCEVGSVVLRVVELLLSLLVVDKLQKFFHLLHNFTQTQFINKKVFQLVKGACTKESGVCMFVLSLSVSVVCVVCVCVCVRVYVLWTCLFVCLLCACWCVCVLCLYMHSPSPKPHFPLLSSPTPVPPTHPLTHPPTRPDVIGGGIPESMIWDRIRAFREVANINETRIVRSTNEYTNTHTHSHIRAHTHTRICAHTHTHSHTHTLTHTCTHTHTHTYVHTHITLESVWGMFF